MFSPSLSALNSLPYDAGVTAGCCRDGLVLLLVAGSSSVLGGPRSSPREHQRPSGVVAVVVIVALAAAPSPEEQSPRRQRPHFPRDRRRAHPACRGGRRGSRRGLRGHEEGAVSGNGTMKIEVANSMAVDDFEKRKKPIESSASSFSLLPCSALSVKTPERETVTGLLSNDSAAKRKTKKLQTARTHAKKEQERERKPPLPQSPPSPRTNERTKTTLSFSTSTSTSTPTLSKNTPTASSRPSRPPTSPTAASTSTATTLWWPCSWRRAWTASSSAARRARAS